MKDEVIFGDLRVKFVGINIIFLVLTAVGFFFQGLPSSIVWWHSVDDLDIGIIGTEVRNV